MIRKFTAEEKAFIWSLQYEYGEDEGVRLGRTPTIGKLMRIMHEESDEESWKMMDQIRRKLAVMTDQEYVVFDFHPDDIEYAPD